VKPIEALRTPDARFQRLPGCRYEPHYVESLPGYEGLRAHYLDLGPKDAKRTFLCLHGEPTWSYLYRKMIPVMLESGARVIAPDFFGFGRSDKPVQDSTYSFHFHREFLLRFVEHVAPRNITLVVQDWGGTLGLTLPVDHGFRSKLDRLFAMNTVLPVGKPVGPHFYEWRALVHKMPDLPVGQLIRNITPQLTDQETAAYDAPFPDSRFKAGARTFPDLAMVEPGMEGVAESVAALRL
jgi:haloalkane dehalogenase